MLAANQHQCHGSQQKVHPWHGVTSDCNIYPLTLHRDRRFLVRVPFMQQDASVKPATMLSPLPPFHITNREQ